MKSIERKELLPLLDLDFSKYEYYIDYLPYRQSKNDTEYFDREDLAWKDIDFDARAKWQVSDDIAKVSENNADVFVNMILEYVNNGKKNS